MFKRTAFVCLLLTGCSAAIEDSTDGAMEEIGEAESPVINGAFVTEEYSGIVALQWNNFNTATTVCSGILMTNFTVLTEEDCARSLPNAGWIRMGTQLRRVAATKYGPAGTRVALLTLNAPMYMPFFGVVLPTGYRRPLHSRTGASLDGSLLSCYGYGGPDSSAAFPVYSLKAGKFTGRWQPWINANDIRLMADPVHNDVILDIDRDAGGPCFVKDASGAFVLASVTDHSGLGFQSGEQWTLLIPSKQWILWVEANLRQSG